MAYSTQNLLLYYLKGSRIAGIYPQEAPGEKMSKSCRLLWRLWSVILLIFSIAIAVVDTMYDRDIPRGPFQDSQTLSIVNIIHNSVAGWTLIVLHFTLWFNSDKLYNLMKNYYKAGLYNFQSKNLVRTFVIRVSFQFLTVPLNVVAYIYVEHMYKSDSFSIFTKTCKIVLLIIFINFTRMAQLNLMDVVNLYITEEFRPFSESAAKISTPTARKKTSAKKVSAILDQENEEEYDSIAIFKQSTKSPIALQSALEKTDFESLNQKIIESFQLLRLCNNYVDIAIAATMLCLLFWMLISTYYAILWMRLLNPQRFMAFTMFVTSVIPTLSFLNATNDLNVKVSLNLTKKLY